MKKIITLLLSFTLLGLLVACGKKTTATDTPKEKVQIKVWHTYTDAQQKYLDKVITDFNASHETIEVVAESQPRKDFEAKVMQAVRAKNGPDVIIHFASEAANYVADDLVVDFAKYIPDNFASSIDAGALKEATSFADGGMHVLPLFTSGPVFFYNTAIYEELGLNAPTTWEELTENSRKIKEAYPDKYGFAADSLADLGQTLFSQNGNTIVDSKEKLANFNTPENADSVAWFAKGVKDGYFMLQPSEQYFANDFNANVLVSYIGSVAGSPYLTEGTWTSAPLPQKGTTPWTPAWNRGVIAFKNGEEKEAAAATFALYLTSADVNAGFCVAANYASPYAATRETQAYKDLIATNAPLAALRPDTAGSFPAIAGTSTVREVIQRVLTEVSTDQKSVEQALNDAITEANTALQDN